MNKTKKKFGSRELEFNSIEYRKKRFEKIFSNEKSNNYIGLINFNKLDTEIYKKLQDQCLDFIIASFDPKIKKINLPQDNDEKLKFINKNIGKLYSMTPNGFIVPKSHSNKEFNALIDTFYSLFDTKELQNVIKYWQEPLGICFKSNDNDRSDLEMKKSGRLYHQTSNFHIESWAGYSNFGINTLLPLFGDTKKNYTEFFEPKENYNDFEVNSVTEKNLNQIKSKNYNEKPANPAFKNEYISGNLICWDNCLLHRTKIEDKKSYRIFIVNQFIPYLSRKESKANIISKYRKIGRLTHNILSSKKHILKFSKINDRRFKSTLGGKRDAYSYKVMRLK